MLQGQYDINYWRKNLGFFPNSLFQRKHLREKYVLLNGKGGNYCVDYSDESPERCRSYAWSANVGQYLTISDNFITIHRWDAKTTEKIPSELVYNNINAFDTYLSKQKFSQDANSVNFALGVYRHIRNSLRDTHGEQALNAFLCALAAAKEGKGLADLDNKKWGLTDNAKNAASALSPIIWDEVMRDLMGENKPTDEKPQLEILLRHASGRIFQDAHFELIYPSQLSLDLFPSLATDRRKANPDFSSHYTPTSIVRSIVEEALRGLDVATRQELTIFDPAVGSGEFLKETLRQLTLKEYSGKIKLIGWDISSTALELAKFSLAFEKQAARYPSNVEIILELQDALTEGEQWQFKCDLILMNPPFVSWEQMSKEQQGRVSSVLKSVYTKRPNIAGAFIYKASKSLTPGGRLGCVIPSSILEADSFQKLRAEIRSDLHIDFLGKLGSLSIFESAITDSSILIAGNSKDKMPTQLMWSDNSDEGYASGLRELRKFTAKTSSPEPFLNFGEGGRYNFYGVSELNDKNWTPIDYEAYQLINYRLRNKPKAKDLFDIRQGVRTGLNKAFIVSKEFFESLPKSEQKYFRKAVTNDSITFGCLNDSSYIFYAEGKYSIESEEELKSVVKNFYNLKFSQFVDQLSSRARKSVANYWRLSEHRAWQLDIKPKIVSKEFGNAGSFAFDSEGVYVAERSHAWLPHNTENWDNLGHAYVAVLSMNIIDDLLKGLSKQIQSGSYYLSGKFLNDMPLPNLFDSSVSKSVKEELIEIGMSLANCDYNKSLKHKLESLTDRVF